jgi:hypothetical protein
MIGHFLPDAPPMAMLESLVAALGTFYRDAKRVEDSESRRRQGVRLLAQMPTLAAAIFRHRAGLPFVQPSSDLSLSENFLRMLFKRADPGYEVKPVLAKAMEVLFILHADHEQNCSTSTIRVAGSSRCDPFRAMAAAIGALSGPLRGGANEAVLRMLAEIGSSDAIPGYIRRVKNGEVRLMGFGHRVYRNYDPRAEANLSGLLAQESRGRSGVLSRGLGALGKNRQHCGRPLAGIDQSMPDARIKVDSIACAQGMKLAVEVKIHTALQDNDKLFSLMRESFRAGLTAWNRQDKRVHHSPHLLMSERLVHDL